MVKIWSGMAIYDQDLKCNTPILTLYLQCLLEKRFKMKFEVRQEFFETQLKQLNYYTIPKRTDYYIYYLVNQIVDKFKQREGIQTKTIYKQFFERYFQSFISFGKYKQLFRQCPKKGLNFKQKGKLLTMILRKSDQFCVDLLDIYDSSYQESIEKNYYYFTNEINKLKDIFVKNYNKKAIFDFLQETKQKPQHLQPITGHEINNSFSYFFFNDPKIPFKKEKVKLDQVKNL